MSEEEKSGADLGIKIAGNEVNIKNVKSLNTIATVTTMVLVATLGVFLYFHEVNAQQDKARLAGTLEQSNSIVAEALKQSNKAVTDALKELAIEQRRATDAINAEQRRSTNAMKEIACLNDPVMRNRGDARDFCKRIARDDR